MCVIGLFVGLRYINSPGYDLQEKGAPDFVLPLILCVVYAVFLGGRPVSRLFGDTINYAREYWDMEVFGVQMNWSGEWVWQWFMVMCKSLDLSLEWFFTLVDLGYFLSVLWAIKKFMPENVLIGMLFIFSSLMFFTFGVNGIRNGVACHILLLAIAFVFSGKMWWGALSAP